MGVTFVDECTELLWDMIMKGSREVQLEESVGSVLRMYWIIVLLYVSAWALVCGW